MLPCLLSIFIILALPGCTRAAPLDLSHYRMTFNDDFSTLSISAYGPATRWIAHTPWNGDFGEAVFGNPGPGGPFSLNANGLAITAQKDATGKWHSGLISSVDHDGPAHHGFAQQYGYFEMKARLPSGAGTWPAFWLIGTDKTTTAAEIDVIEYYGGFPKYYITTEHVWLNGANQLLRQHTSKVPEGILSSQFNTFGVLITPTSTSFYFNRQEYWSTSTPPEYRQPMYMLVDLALGGGWPINKLPSPVVMDVQYVRAYQKNP